MNGALKMEAILEPVTYESIYDSVAYYWRV